MATDIFNMADAWNAAQTFNAIKMDVTATAHNADSQLLNLLTGGVQRFGVRAPHIANGSDTTPFLNMVDVWNTSGTITGIKYNVTDTASNAASLLVDLQVSGVSRAAINKAGAIALTGTFSAPFLRPKGFSSLEGFFNDSGSGGVGFRTNGGAVPLLINNGSVDLMLASSIGFGGSNDVNFFREAADEFSMRRGSNAASFYVHSTYSSATDYHRLALKSAKTTLSNVSGASVTATGLIPDGAVVVGVTTKVTTALGTSNGTTGYQVGDGTDADRWGAITGTAAGTSSDNRDWTATTVQAFTSAQDVVITATGGNFNGTGAIVVSVQYLMGQCD